MTEPAPDALPWHDQPQSWREERIWRALCNCGRDVGDLRRTLWKRADELLTEDQARDAVIAIFARIVSKQPKELQ